MPCRSSFGRSIALFAFIACACAALSGCGSKDKADKPRDATEPRTWVVNAGEAHFAVTRESLADYEKALARWSGCRAYEKLAVAEELLRDLTSEDLAEWAPGPRKADAASDLSRVAVRAKRALERILGMPLPDIRRDSSPQDLAELQVQASRLVEAFRGGLMAIVSDHPLSPADFARLRQRYRGKIVDSPSPGKLDPIMAMEELLGEFQPIGRRMEDLVSIIGGKSEYWDGYTNGQVFYRIYGADGMQVDHFYFTVAEGIIRSVRRRPHNG